MDFVIQWSSPGNHTRTIFDIHLANTSIIVQTYKHYTHSALLNAIQSERDSTGILNFYFAGIPAWAMSSGLAIARENPLKRVFVSLRDYAQYLTGESLGVRSLFGLIYTV